CFFQKQSDWTDTEYFKSDRRRVFQSSRSRLPSGPTGRVRKFCGVLAAEVTEMPDSRARRDYSLALTVRGVISSSDPQEGTSLNVRITPQSTDTSLVETPGHCVSDLVASTALVRLSRIAFYSLLLRHKIGLSGIFDTAPQTRFLVSYANRYAKFPFTECWVTDRREDACIPQETRNLMSRIREDVTKSEHSQTGIPTSNVFSPLKLEFSITSPFGHLNQAPRGMIAASSVISSTVAARRSSSFNSFGMGP
ncbi:hypothetical protein ALC57_16130, partial [Trachymyrmex cornetzi]